MAGAHNDYILMYYRTQHSHLQARNQALFLSIIACV